MIKGPFEEVECEACDSQVMCGYWISMSHKRRICQPNTWLDSGYLLTSIILCYLLSNSLSKILRCSAAQYLTVPATPLWASTIRHSNLDVSCRKRFCLGVAVAVDTYASYMRGVEAVIGQYLLTWQFARKSAMSTLQVGQGLTTFCTLRLLPEVPPLFNTSP